MDVGEERIQECMMLLQLFLAQRIPVQTPAGERPQEGHVEPVDTRRGCGAQELRQWFIPAPPE